MTRQIVFALSMALFGLAATAGEAPQERPKTAPTAEAKAKFLKKCFRDRTKRSCDAPEQHACPFQPPELQRPLHAETRAVYSSRLG